MGFKLRKPYRRNRKPKLKKPQPSRNLSITIPFDFTLNVKDSEYDPPCSATENLPIDQSVNITHISFHRDIWESDLPKQHVRVFDSLSNRWYNRYWMSCRSIFKEYDQVITEDQWKKYERFTEGET